MKYSQLFGKTVKSVPKDAQSIPSHALLYQAGFVRESTAGRQYLLPLAVRVRHKIIEIIKEEMDRAGAQELYAPVLHPLELWQETNRTNETGFELMVVKDRREKFFALGGTAEEMIVDLVRKFQLSYKDLPFNVYQFSQKFRDELRARGGLLRVREFLMKDAYSFHATKEDFQKEYKNMEDTYVRIFNRLGLEVRVVAADNGYIGGEYSHEFIVESEVGESVFFVSEDGSYAAHEDVAAFDRGQMNPDEPTKVMEVIEQPEWVKSMVDNQNHYGEPTWRFIKNVGYRNRITQEIIIATVRGDLEVNKTKLEKVLHAVGQLEEADDAALKVMGTQRGYVHSWGHMGATYVGDISLTSVRNFIGGQKAETTDTFNVNYGRDFECNMLADIAMAKPGFEALDGKGPLSVHKGIEVGNIFQLGYHYSEKMSGAVYTDEKGKEKKYYMGCYGIGVERTLATIVEKYHDEKGITWPSVVAPFDVQLISLKGAEKEVEEVYAQLQTAGFTVLHDDRDVSAGEKFADSDLIGNPVRVVISERSLASGGAEVKARLSEESRIIELANLPAFVSAQFSSK